jgi:ABC-2 type transport system ATP-binding protein
LGLTPSTRICAVGVSCTLSRRTILDDVSLELAAPVTVLLGVNGAGKTTLFRVLAGIVAPSRGTVTFTSPGRPTRPIADRDYSVGYLPQSPSPVRGLRVGDYLEYFAFLKHLPRQAARDQIGELLAVTGLEAERRTPTRRLSGGMMRRLALAAAVLGSPTVVLLDEPTAGLDPEQRIRMRELVREVGTRAPVLVSTHLAEDAAHVGDHLVVLHDGRVVRDQPMTHAWAGSGPDAAAVEQLFLAAVRQDDA